MSSKPRLSVGEAEERGWQECEVLKELHVRRGWTPTDISRKFDVDLDAVKGELRELDLYQEGQNATPKFGLAREIWEQGLDPVEGGENA